MAAFEFEILRMRDFARASGHTAGIIFLAPMQASFRFHAIYGISHYHDILRHKAAADIETLFSRLCLLFRFFKIFSSAAMISRL